MSNTAKFCRKCGKPLAENDRFCRACGEKVVTVEATEAAPSTPKALNNPQTPPYKNLTASFVPPPRPEPKKKNKKAGRRFVAVLLVAVLLFTSFVKPGFLRKKPGGGKTGTSTPGSIGMEAASADFGTLLPDDFEKETVTEGTLTLENSTIEKDGVSVTVATGFLGEDRKIEVNRITENVEYSFDGEEPVLLTMYEVNIEGIHEGSMIDICLPMDKNAAPEYGAGYLDPETHRLKPALSKYDPETGMLTIHTTHLSTFCGIPIKNEKTKKAALAYLNAYDLLDDDRIENYQALVALLGTSIDSGENIQCGISVLDAISLLQEGGSVATDLAKVPITETMSGLAEGSSKIIFMGGNQGTIGEIMNTNWGKAGTYSLAPEFGKTATRIEGYDQTLKSVYPGKVINKISSGLTNAGRLLSLYKIAKSISKEGWTSPTTATESIKWVAAELLSYYASHGAPAALGVYLIGVAAVGFTLDYIVAEVQAGRKEVFVHGYTKYYGGDGHRTDDDWIKVFKDIQKEGGSGPEFTAEIDRYVNEFWTKADEGDIDYLVNIISDEDKAAWGIATAQGLTPEIREEISKNYKARLCEKRMPDIMAQLTLENQMEMLEKYQAEIDGLTKQWNQQITLYITSADAPTSEKDHSMYEGCIVRFKDLAGKVDDPKAWECTLNREGSGSITFTLLAHMIANAGTELEIVRPDGSSEDVLLTDSFVFKDTDAYEYTRVSANYVIPATEEEEEILGDFPNVSEDMTIETVFGNKFYTKSAQFALDADGTFTISIPDAYLDNYVTMDNSTAHIEIQNVNLDPFTLEGDLSSGTSSVSDGVITLTSKDVSMPDAMQMRHLEQDVYYPQSDHPLTQNMDVSTSLTMIKNETDVPSITVTVTPGGSGGTLRVEIHTKIKNSFHTVFVSDGETKDDWMDTDETVILETEIDKDLLKKFQTCFK